MHDPATSYLRRSVEGASPIGLIVLLFQRGVLALRRSVDALERGDIETRTFELNRALAIVAELKSVLDFDRGGAVARNFEQFYQLAEATIIDASCRQRAQPLLELCEQFVRIRDAWQQVEGQPHPTAAMAVPQSRPNTAGEVRLSWKA